MGAQEQAERVGREYQKVAEARWLAPARFWVSEAFSGKLGSMQRVHHRSRQSATWGRANRVESSAGPNQPRRGFVSVKAGP